jgi:hypothetical protein
MNQLERTPTRINFPTVIMNAVYAQFDSFSKYEYTLNTRMLHISLSYILSCHTEHINGRNDGRCGERLYGTRAQYHISMLDILLSHANSNNETREVTPKKWSWKPSSILVRLKPFLHPHELKKTVAVWHKGRE